MIAELSSGDARVALDTLGFIAENIPAGRKITTDLVAEAMQTKMTFYDKGEDKYNLLSALQKSVRGSDPDAAVHYLARLIEGGADIQTIGRTASGHRFGGRRHGISAGCQYRHLLRTGRADDWISGGADTTGTGGDSAVCKSEIEFLHRGSGESVCRSEKPKDGRGFRVI